MLNSSMTGYSEHVGVPSLSQRYTILFIQKIAGVLVKL